MKDRFKKALQFCKENPYEVGFYVITAAFAVQTVNCFAAIKIANKNAKTIDMANQMFEWIAQAVESGAEIVVDRELGVFDFIPKAVEAAAQD